MPSPTKNGKVKADPDSTVRVERGSGNVFADIGLPNPELALAKAKLVQQLRAVIVERKVGQAKAAALLGLDPSKLAALVRGRTERYTLDRLFRFLTALGQQVEITVRPATDDGDRVVSARG